MVTTLTVWLRTVKWWAWAAVGALLSVGAWILTRLFLAPHEVEARPPAEAVVRAQANTAAAEEAALAARVEARTEAEAHRTTLTQIAAIPDGAERRRRLADMLTTLK